MPGTYLNVLVIQHTWKFLPTIQSAVSVPIIANGDVFTPADIMKTRQETGCSSVMIARGALWNVSIFSPTLRDKNIVMKEYLEEAIKWENHFGHTKYTMVRSYQNETKNPIYPNIVKSKNYEQLIEAFKDIQNIPEKQIIKDD